MSPLRSYHSKSVYAELSFYILSHAGQVQIECNENIIAQTKFRPPRGRSCAVDKGIMEIIPDTMSGKSRNKPPVIVLKSINSQKKK